MPHAICLMSITVHTDKNSNPSDHWQAGVSINQPSTFSATRKLVARLESLKLRGIENFDPTPKARKEVSICLQGKQFDITTFLFLYIVGGAFGSIGIPGALPP